MRERDVIVWLPLHANAVVAETVRVHRCPTAVVGFGVTRGMLDPMALGVCRYCKEELP